MSQRSRYSSAPYNVGEKGSVESWLDNPNHPASQSNAPSVAGTLRDDGTRSSRHSREDYYDARSNQESSVRDSTGSHAGRGNTRTRTASLRGDGAPPSVRSRHRHGDRGDRAPSTRSGRGSEGEPDPSQAPPEWTADDRTEDSRSTRGTSRKSKASSRTAVECRHSSRRQKSSRHDRLESIGEDANEPLRRTPTNDERDRDLNRTMRDLTLEERRKPRLVGEESQAFGYDPSNGNLHVHKLAVGGFSTPQAGGDDYESDDSRDGPQVREERYTVLGSKTQIKARFRDDKEERRTTTLVRGADGKVGKRTKVEGKQNALVRRCGDPKSTTVMTRKRTKKYKSEERK